MDTTIERVVIVGGGTAGWLTAVYLATFLNRDSARPVAITLIESSEIGTIGVGESTLPTLPQSLALLGIDEADWMLRCNSSFKMCVKFVNWRGGGADDVFWNPVEPLAAFDGRPLSAYWLKRSLAGETEPFGEACFITPRLAAAKRAPKLANGQTYTEYAYHVDAGLLAAYLREVALTRGVTHIVDTVDRAVLDGRGLIDHVVTRGHGSVAADLFVDCSGFRGLLINQALGGEFLSYGDLLLCDRAIAIPIPKDPSQDGIEPVTTATALDGGWAWNVPLVHRDGTGYVYSGRFLEPEAAEREFRAFLGPRAEGVEARHLRMRVGRNRDCWVKNCVSIGLASGFIEPLEATGIYLIEAGVQALLNNIPERRLNPARITAYNEAMGRAYDDIRDFIVLHYSTSPRRDTPFWQATNRDVTLPASLDEKLERWSRELPVREHFAPGSVFSEATHSCILLGMEYWRDRGAPDVSDVDAEAAAGVFAELRVLAEALTELAPDQYRYLRRISREEDAAAPVGTVGGGR